MRGVTQPSHGSDNQPPSFTSIYLENETNNLKLLLQHYYLLFLVVVRVGPSPYYTAIVVEEGIHLRPLTSAAASNICACRKEFFFNSGRVRKVYTLCNFLLCPRAYFHTTCSTLVVVNCIGSRLRKRILYNSRRVRKVYTLCNFLRFPRGKDLH